MTDVYLVGEDDETVEGTIPEGLWLLLIGVPREIAIEVAQYEAVDTEVATYCYQTAGFTQMGVGEDDTFV